MIKTMSDFAPDPSSKKPGKIRRQLRRLRAFMLPAGPRFLASESERDHLGLLLEQAPQAYIAWPEGGKPILSPLLGRWLGRPVVADMDTIIGALTVSDGAALANLWQRL